MLLIWSAPCAAEKIYGFSFPSWWHNSYELPASQKSLEDLAATGAGWVVIIPTWYMERADSNLIRPTQSTASDDSLEKVIRRAKALGLKVMLKPHVDIETGKARATIKAADPSIWFAHYRKMILHYAAMARKLNAEMFCVGTELYLMTYEIHEPYWRIVIEDARKAYSGPIIYAANWYDYGKIGFWDALDAIGIDAYFPLPAGPSKQGMIKNWTTFYIPALERAVRKHGKPVLFTEIGIASQKGAHLKPAAWWEFGDLDLELQKDYYEALIESFQGKDWFAGFIQWAWELDPNAGGPEDKSMTVQRKPALQVLKKFFSRPSSVFGHKKIQTEDRRPAAGGYTALAQDFFAQTQLPRISAAETAK